MRSIQYQDSAGEPADKIAVHPGVLQFEGLFVQVHRGADRYAGPSAALQERIPQSQVA